MMRPPPAHGAGGGRIRVGCLSPYNAGVCGRFVSVASPELLAKRFHIDEVESDDLGARYNVAPRALIYGITQTGGVRTLESLRWGLVPFWAKELKVGDRMINARAETVDEKPAYRRAFKEKRCLVPATAFYEWQRVAGQKRKQPWLFRARHGEPMAFAGLWETWRDPETPDDEPLRSTVIVTTNANELMKPVHDRMPVILPESCWSEWLDPDRRDTEALKQLLVPSAEDVLEKHPVSTDVSNVRNQGPQLVEPVEVSDEPR